MNWILEKRKEVQKYAARREWTLLAEACVKGAELLLCEVLPSASSQLSEADRLAFNEVERRRGEGKGIESFGLGELVGLIRESKFFDKWEKASARNLHALRLCNLDEINKLRNRLTHKGAVATEAEALLTYVFFQSCLDAFALGGESLPTRETFFGWVPALDADLWRPLPPDPEPFKLLTWRTRLASFVGRQLEIDTLLKWASDSDADPRVRILTGSGGAGKTRLGAEICSELRVRGWTAEFLQTGQMPDSYEDKPALYVIDYPEERKDEISKLFSLVKKIKTRNTPLRLLFLSRKDIGWWETTSFLRDLHVVALFESREIRLLMLSKQDAATLFQEACEKVCDHYKLQAVNITKDQIFDWYSRDEQLNSLPLFITATAIQCALDGDAGLSLGGAEVIQALVKRERERLGPIGSVVGLEHDAASRLVALAGIPGGIDSSLVRRLADPALEIGLPPPDQVVNALRRTALWEHHSVPAASPDICAASLLFSVLDDRPDMASQWLWAVLQDIKQGVPDILGRLSHDISLVHSSKQTKHSSDSEVNREKLPPARQFAQWLIEMLNNDAERAKVLEEMVTEFRPPVSVLPISVEVGRILTDSPASDETKHAQRLHCLGERLWESGRFKEAQRPIEEAIALRRKLSQSNPLTKPELGNSLNAYALILNAINKNDEAIIAVNEGVAILREVANNGDVDSLHALGRCLNTKHVVYFGKDLAAAREAASEVVDIHDSLSKKMPDRFDIWLARGLHNLSNCETDIMIATETLKRAVKIKRSLKEKAPWRYESEFALSAALMVKRFLNQNEPQEAHQLSKEVLTIYSRLFEVNPTRFASDFLNALHVNELILRKLGRTKEALSSEDRRVTLMERLLAIREGVIEEEQQIELLFSLVTTANHASHLSRYDEARRACDKVLQIASEMKTRNPDVWNPRLHMAVMGAHLNRGNARYGGESETREAIEDYSAAIRLCDEFEARSGVNGQNLVARLLAQTNKAIEMFKDGQSEEPRTLAKDIIEGEQRLRGEFGEKRYFNHEAELIRSLKILIDHLIPLQSRELTDGVAGILLRLAETTGANLYGENAQEQASCQLLLGESLLRAGCGTEALGLLKQGVDLGRQVVSQMEQFSDVEFLNDLGYCMARLQEQDSDYSNFDEAQSYITRAISLVKADDDYLRSNTLDSLGYIQTLYGTRRKDPELLTLAIRTFEEARLLALKINRQDLLPAVDRHIIATRAALMVLVDAKSLE